jgi:predicted small lipoprotein YifL
MKTILKAATAAALLSLAACGGKGDDALGDNAADAADARADNLEAAADNASGTREDALDAQADATREAGEAREEAIDDSDVNAHALSDAEKNALVNGQ